MHSTTLPELLDVVLAEPPLSAHPVARLPAVPRSSVHEYARRLHRPLPSIAVGRHRRFYRGDVEVWLAEQRVRAASPGGTPWGPRCNRQGGCSVRASSEAASCEFCNLPKEARK